MYSSTQDMAVDLPPGRYLIAAEGRNSTGSHGEVWSSRTPYGKQEHWVEVTSEKTTSVRFDLPVSGWLQVDLQATGQPDPKLMQQEAPRDPNFVLHNQTSGQATTLSFPKWVGGSVYMDSTHLAPGKKEGVLEVFSPGNYELEVRIPGFPLQRLPLTIQAKKWTTAKILLQGI